jgi:amino acid transporter
MKEVPMSTIDARGSSSSTQGGEGTSLAAGTLTLPEVLMQAITHIAPAVGLVLSVGFITSQAGIVSPLSFGLAFIIVLLLGLNLTQLAKHLPGAGGLFTYVSRTLGPRFGFFAAWNFFAYEPIGAAINYAWMGKVFEDLMDQWYWVNFPWWLFFILGTGITAALMLFGVKMAGRTVLILGAAEIAIMLALGVSGLLDAGPGGVNLDSFNPSNATSGNGIFLGIVFAMFGFCGFESVAPLAEETADPKRNVPRAILYSIVAMGIYYVFASWMMITAWGTEDVEGFIGDSTPVFTLADRLWGGGKVLVLLAVVNSVIAVAIAASNASTRVFFAMGRVGAMPKWFAQVNPKTKTPANAVIAQSVFTLAFGLFFGFVWLEPINTLFFFGLVITYILTALYTLTNLGVIRYYLTERRSEFNVFSHMIFPIFTSGALLFVAYKSWEANSGAPFKYALPATMVWIAVGVGVTLFLGRRGDWINRAGQVYGGND